MTLQEKMGELRRCFKGRNRQELADEDKIKDSLLCGFSIPFMLEEEMV